MSLAYRMRNMAMKCSRLLTKGPISAERQQKIVDSFSEPKDIIERSYFQYKTTMQEWSFGGRLLAESASFFLLRLYLKKLSNVHIDFEKNIDMICFVAKNQDNIIAKALKKEYPNLLYGDTVDSMCIDKYDLDYLTDVYRRFKHSYYYKFKILLRLSAYSANIKKYAPKVFVSAAEHSFSNTLCTDYCEKKNIMNIVCQHGEYWRRLSGSFFYVHKYYAWDEYYIKLHNEHRAYIPTYYIQIPEAISNLGVVIKDSYPYFGTYYLAYENRKELNSIKQIFSELRENGRECKIRLHPRGRISNERLVRTIFAEYCVEDCDNVSLGESMNTSQYLISIRSTVLLQGYINKKNIIIDDMTDRILYEKLADWGYVMLAKKHERMSNIIKEKNDEFYMEDRKNN